MTKEIIIDGIDVSDCMYYEPKAIKMTCHEQAITKPCNTSPICYYKLLHKANKNCESLEQENKKLKNILKEIRDLKKSQNIKDDVLKMIENFLNEIDEVQNDNN